MQACEQKSRGEAATTISTLFTHFKPRQVILNSNSNMNHLQLNGVKTLISLSADNKLLLLQSICQFFEQSGFSKALTKFCKEAHIEKESWKSCQINLEEMCYHYLKMRNDSKISDSATKEQATNQKDGGVDDVATVGTLKKAKKNEGDEEKKSQEKVESQLVNGADVKFKKKKKSKSGTDLSEQIVEETHSKNTADVSVCVPSEPEKKSKDKKNKRKNECEEEMKEVAEVKLAELPAEEILEKPDSVSGEERKGKSKNRKKKEDALTPNDSSIETIVVDKEKKASKKRKKLSEENESGCIEKASSDDSKRRKTDDLDPSNGTILPKTPNGSANGALEKDERKESHKKDNSRQQHNDSSEPRTSANAFRRVKEEEVEFVDERLQDNSYWAKDGADSGYGAKAQEVLGQVRGRDFRHEKTKKKRGSYRGGQIDLQSHSVKFNYDDDE